MDAQFEIELTELRQKLLLMANCAEAAVKQSLQAIATRDRGLALKVRDADDAIDRFELEIDQIIVMLCTKAPLAGDLRLVTEAMKISQNLERIGDEATKIARRARDLADEPPLPIKVDLTRLGNLALDMFKAALDAFQNGDATAARAIIPRDKEVDALNREVREALVKQMMKNPEIISRSLHWIVAAKSLERIADHVKNIAEAVVYLYGGEDIRHAKATGKAALVSHQSW